MEITKDIIQKIKSMYPDEDTYSGLAWKVIAEYGLSKKRHRDIRRKIGKLYGRIKNEEEKLTVDERSGSITYEYNGTKRIENFEDAVRHCGVDLDVWEIDRKLFNSWEVTMKTNDTPVTRTNYQYKLWFKRRKNEYSKSDLIRDLHSSLSDIFIRSSKRRGEKKNGRGRGSGNALETDIFDAHLGKLAWGKETGENYDIKIAKERYLDTISDLIYKARGHDVEQIYHIIGQDYFHVDTMFNTTAKGTQLDTDVRWQKSWTEGRTAAIQGIEMLRQVAPVKVLMSPGNHDTQRIFYLGDLIDMVYEKAGDVDVDNTPGDKKFFRWGKCAVMLIHGDEGKFSEYPLVLTRYAMKNGWHDVEFMEVHTGHFHKTRKYEHLMADEFHGIVVRTLPSIAGTDAWHYRKNFTDNIKGSEAFIWNKSNGLEGMLKSNIL